jgi:hypothetical protein
LIHSKGHKCGFFLCQKQSKIKFYNDYNLPFTEKK